MPGLQAQHVPRLHLAAQFSFWRGWGGGGWVGWGGVERARVKQKEGFVREAYLVLFFVCLSQLLGWCGFFSLKVLWAHSGTPDTSTYAK